MKKLLLLASAVFIGFGATAQNAQPIGGGVKQAIPTYQIRNTPPPVAGKSTVGGGRWYDHMGTVNFFNGNIMSTSLMPIWFDSTIMQNFNTGLSNINFISAAEIIDPIGYDLYNDPNVFTEANTIKITSGNAYTVDSVSVQCAYVRNPSRLASIVDTLIFSVSPSTFSYYIYNKTTRPWISAYVALPDTQLRAFTILDIDSINRASANTGVVMWKVPLTDAMRQDDSAGFVDIQTFDFPTPSPVNIPAGNGVAVTVTFKTGDVVPVPNVDTFSEYHNFSLFEGEALGDGQVMPYYYYTHGDRSMSNLMFSSDTGFYAPCVAIEGTNTPDFRQEFHGIAAHTVCPTCNTLSVSDTKKSNVSMVSAYPNPANNEVNISFTVGQAGSANVIVTNTVGQVMSAQTLKAIAGKNNVTTVSTSGMAAGVYFYTIESNGQRTTERFVVSH